METSGLRYVICPSNFGLAPPSCVLLQPRAIAVLVAEAFGAGCLTMWSATPATLVAFCAGLWVSNPVLALSQEAGGRPGADCEGERCETCLHSGGTALQRSCCQLWLLPALTINNISLGKRRPCP